MPHTLDCDPPAHEVPTPGPLLFERLLAYFLQEVHDPGERAWVEKLLHSNARWQAHARSAADLALELTAARRAARELTAFPPDAARDFCRATASSGGRILDDVICRTGAKVGRRRIRQWERHIDHCVYCRWMKRARLARIEAALEGLPEGEPLLRDWALARVYREPLEQATRRLLGNAADPTVPASVDGPTPMWEARQGEPSEQEDRECWKEAVARVHARHRGGPTHEVLKAIAERLRTAQGPPQDVVDQMLQQTLGKTPGKLRKVWMELQTARFAVRAPR